MDSQLGPNIYLDQDQLADGLEVRSDPRASTRSKASEHETCSTQKGRTDITVMSVNTAAAHSPSNKILDEEIPSPLRLTLARRSVQRKIFTFMDQGDKKTEIESRTGLSHRCIKWHRQLWRTECSHPRPRSKKIPQGSSRRSQSPSARNERPSKKRPACEGRDGFSVAGACSSDKRRRKHRTVKQSIGRPVCARTEKLEPGGGNCAERGRNGSVCLTGKENMPGKDEAMVVSVLPIRDLRP